MKQHEGTGVTLIAKAKNEIINLTGNPIGNPHCN